ncbi:hypothetical protein K1X76_09960 [bacterium]|nr:hypothetical protein [bacterium]
MKINYLLKNIAFTLLLAIPVTGHAKLILASKAPIYNPGVWVSTPEIYKQKISEAFCQPFKVCSNVEVDENSEIKYSFDSCVEDAMGRISLPASVATKIVGSAYSVSVRLSSCLSFIDEYQNSGMSLPAVHANSATPTEDLCTDRAEALSDPNYCDTYEQNITLFGLWYSYNELQRGTDFCGIDFTVPNSCN